MTRKTLTITLIAGICSTGCSTITERLSIQRIDDSAETSKEMVYDFIQPRRSALSAAFNKKNNATSSQPHIYYSASGYKCQIISSLNKPKSACLINGRWKETAPIFKSNIPG